MSRRAFTLIELMIVIGIMGAMAVMSVGGYRALVKGMRDRAALTAVQTLFDAARQRAEIDRRKVLVFLYDDLLKSGEDPVGHGTAIAVRPVGRLSAVDGNYLCDEFGDLDQVYASENALEGDVAANRSNTSKMRLYIMKEEGNGSYVDVKTTVAQHPVDASYIISGETPPGGGESGEKRIPCCAFEKSGGGSFNVGDAYGAEFASVELPDGYYFGGSAPRSVGRASVRVVTISADGSVSGGDISVSAMKASSTSLEEVGKAKVKHAN